MQLEAQLAEAHEQIAVKDAQLAQAHNQTDAYVQQLEQTLHAERCSLSLTLLTPTLLTLTLLVRS